MTNDTDLDKKLDSILEELNYLGMVIKNLKDREGKSVTDLGEIDERLFKEITAYEFLTEELKKNFLMLLMFDAKRLLSSNANMEVIDGVAESLEKIENLIDMLSEHETEDIQKSRDLQSLTGKAKTKLKEIKNEMERNDDIKKNQKQKFAKDWRREPG